MIIKRPVDRLHKGPGVRRPDLVEAIGFDLRLRWNLTEEFGDPLRVRSFVIWHVEHHLREADVDDRLWLIATAAYNTAADAELARASTLEERWRLLASRHGRGFGPSSAERKLQDLVRTRLADRLLRAPGPTDTAALRAIVEREIALRSELDEARRRHGGMSSAVPPARPAHDERPGPSTMGRAADPATRWAGVDGTALAAAIRNSGQLALDDVVDHVRREHLLVATDSAGRIELNETSSIGNWVCAFTNLGLLRAHQDLANPSWAPSDCRHLSGAALMDHVVSLGRDVNLVINIHTGPSRESRDVFMLQHWELAALRRGAP